MESPLTRKDSVTRDAQRDGLLRTAFMTGLASRYTFINQNGEGGAGSGKSGSGDGNATSE